MIKLPSLFSFAFLAASCWIWSGVYGQMLGEYQDGQLERRQNGNRNNNGNNNKPNTNDFTIVNGRIFTPGLGIILSPQPFTPMGGDFLQVAIDVSGDGKLPVPPRNIDDPLTQVFNFTMFLTSIAQQKNFTISNITTTTPPIANIMNQEPGSTVKHVNFEWPDCLVGNGKEDFNTTARGDYNITIHQNFRLNGQNHYTIFNLPISVTNSIEQFPGANQLLSKPPPGPVNANGGRVSCASISNPFIGIGALVQSVSNPPGIPFQQIQIQTTQSGQGGQIGQPGNGGNTGQPSNGGKIGNTPSPNSNPLGAASRTVSGAFPVIIIMTGAMAIGMPLYLW